MNRVLLHLSPEAGAVLGRMVNEAQESEKVVIERLLLGADARDAEIKRLRKGIIRTSGALFAAETRGKVTGNDDLVLYASRAREMLTAAFDGASANTLDGGQ